MKKIIILLSVVAVLVSCEEDSPGIKPPVHNLVTVNDPNEVLRYKIKPIAANKLIISFWFDGDRKLDNIRLTKDNVDLATAKFEESPNTIFTAEIDYPFSIGNNATYKLMLTTKVLLDTIYQYQLDYSHIFKQAFTYEKKVDWKYLLEYDIDPNRQNLFYTDYVNNEFFFKRISLNDFTTQSFPINFSAGPIRAVSENEILTYARYYDDHYPLQDSAALVKHNLTTNTSQFIDWISSDYIRLSRIVNGHIIYNNPIFTSKTSTMVDVSTLSKTVFAYNDLNPMSIRSDNFDNLYSGNKIYDWSSGTFVDPAVIPEKAAVFYADNNEHYSLAIETVQEPFDWEYQTRLLIYQDGNLVQTGEWQPSCDFFLGKVIRVENNKILYFRRYTYATNPGISGYYTTDLTTGETSLVHNDGDEWLVRDFAFSNNTLISLRGDGLYKITY